MFSQRRKVRGASTPGDGGPRLEPMASLPEIRVFAGDAVGRLKVLYTQSKRYDTMEVPGCKYGAGAACQLLACSMLATEPPICVVRVRG